MGRSLLFLLEYLVHLDTFPNWLERYLMKIKRINMNLKKIAKEKEIRTLSLFSHSKRKCKKDVKEEEVTYGASDEDIGNLLIPYFNTVVYLYLMQY
jgi:hypothetical protein